MAFLDDSAHAAVMAAQYGICYLKETTSGSYLKLKRALPSSSPTPRTQPTVPRFDDSILAWGEFVAWDKTIIWDIEKAGDNPGLEQYTIQSLAKGTQNYISVYHAGGPSEVIACTGKQKTDSLWQFLDQTRGWSPENKHPLSHQQWPAFCIRRLDNRKLTWKGHKAGKHWNLALRLH